MEVGSIHMESWSPSTVASDSAVVDQTVRWEDYEMDPCEAALFLQNLHKEELISKTVYHCHRCAKRRPSQPSIKGCKPVSSKKEIQCRYELVTYHLKSDPNVFYVFERHPHTGHDPMITGEDSRWRRPSLIVRERVFELLEYMEPLQVLDELQNFRVPLPPTVNVSRITLDHIYALRKQWIMRTRSNMSDFEAVEAMLQRDNFPLLYHNPSGEKQTNDVLGISHLFQLAVCSEFQAAMLKNFGDMVFIDAVHGTTKYGYFQLTILVMDEYGNGCPVAFCMSPVENCEVWVKFIKEVFLKAGREINQTTFMMDKSTVNIAAMKTLSAKYVFCVFHMMQDFDRRLNKDALLNNPKIRKIIKTKVLSRLRQLRRIKDEGTFRAASANFKKFIRESHKFIRAEQFVAYYEKEWEPCSRKWAAYGRKEIAHFEQDTNNLLESFFNKQKYRLTLRKRRMKRLDDHLNLLVNRVMPSCFRDRRHKLEGVKIDPGIGENAKIEHQVSKLLHENMLWFTDPERGAGDAISFSDESIHHSFCLADLTCTCMNGSTHGCVHLEAASKLMETQFGGFQFKNLENAASLIRSQNLMKKIETEFMNEDVYECINLSAWGFLVKRPPPASQMTLTNAHSGHCSCNMFSKADICPHLLALSRCICTFEENETFDPSIFRVKRRCSKKPILDIEPTMLGNTFEREISNENSTASERKYTTKAKSILGSISQYAKQVLPEYTAIFESDLRSVLDKLKNFYIGKFPTAWPHNQRMLEQNYSRKSTDNIHKALYPNASSSKKRSRLSLSQSCPNSSSR